MGRGRNDMEARRTEQHMTETCFRPLQRDVERALVFIKGERPSGRAKLESHDCGLWMVPCAFTALASPPIASFGAKLARSVL